MIERHICPETMTATGICHCSKCEEKRLRDHLIARARDAKNIAPGSPLHDRLMGVHVVEGALVFSAKFREQHAGKEFVIADEAAEVSEDAWRGVKIHGNTVTGNSEIALGFPDPERRSIISTICKIAARILLVILLGGVAVAVMV